MTHDGSRTKVLSDGGSFKRPQPTGLGPGILAPCQGPGAAKQRVWKALLGRTGAELGCGSPALPVSVQFLMVHDSANLPSRDAQSGQVVSQRVCPKRQHVLKSKSTAVSRHFVR